MTLLQKYKKEIFWVISLTVVYFFTRLLFLTNLPIFTDEAIYIRWAQIALHDASWRFISLTDGKPPLQTWIMMGFLKVIQDPLTAGRLVSVTSGFFSMAGIYFLSNILFRNKKVALISCLVYVFYPLALLHDRLAIEDSLSAMWYIWSLYFSVKLLKKVRLDSAYTLGFSLGAGALTKSIGFISMALLPFLLLLFDIKQKNYRKRFFALVGLACVSVFIGLVMYNVLRLSPLFGVVSVKNTTFIYPLHDWLAQSNNLKYLHFTGNMSGLIQWLLQYMNVCYIFFFISGIIGRKYWKEKIVLVLYFLIPFLYLAVFGKVLFPRYMLFMSVMLLPIIGYGVVQTYSFLERKSKTYTQLILPALTIIALLPTMTVSWTLIVDPVNSNIPLSDKTQYITGWPAGWGVTEAIQYFKTQSQTQHIFVGTQGTFGLMPFAFEMYFYNDPRVTTKAYWPINTTIPSDLLAEAKMMPTYIYFYEPCDHCPATGVAPAGWPVTPVFTITKNNGMVHATLYKVNP